MDQLTTMMVVLEIGGFRDMFESVILKRTDAYLFNKEGTKTMFWHRSSHTFCCKKEHNYPQFDIGSIITTYM